MIVCVISYFRGSIFLENMFVTKQGVIQSIFSATIEL